MASNLPDSLATLVIWPRQTRVLVFQSQLQILSHITQHTVSSSVYACVQVAEGIQVKEATEGFKTFQRRAERNSMAFELERNPGKKLLPQRLS